ncbi:MAG: hypothetical protein R2825_24440 [Saprospiraceae bacterium]
MENVKNRLLSALKNHELITNSQEGKIINLNMGYTIEIEGENLFKLIHGGQVIAPFADIEELCSFIKMDMQLNEED